MKRRDRVFSFRILCISALILVACNDRAQEKQKAEADRVIKESQEMAAKAIENANQLVESSKELAKEQLEHAQGAIKNAGEAASAQADKAIADAKKAIDANAVFPPPVDPQSDPNIRREAQAIQMGQQMKTMKTVKKAK